jgi:hypothetical protein
MKKYLMILVAVICFEINTNANTQNVVFRETQTVCNGQTGETFIFSSDGTFADYQNDVLSYQGTYDITGNHIAIAILDDDGNIVQQFRGSANIQGNTLVLFILQNVQFRPNEC